ncbi:MAG: KEOPS complex subunit Pcc1 [Candidatus Ranarchaeia archaeon]
MGIKTIQSEVTLIFHDSKITKIIENSLKPEITMDIGQRAETSIKRKNEIIKIDISAPDVSSLRASINSLLRWISMIQKIYSL